MFFSCNTPQTQNEDQVKITPGEGTGSSVLCSTDVKCQLRCKTLFETSKAFYDKCLKERSGDVAQLDKVLSAMEKGSWKSIKPESLKVLVEFEKDLWLKYAQVRNKTVVQDMLLWVAENEDIARHLDEQHEVLKSAFSALGGSAEEDKKVQAGMKKDIDTKESRTFLEVSIFKKNKPAFEEAHKLLVKECNESNLCVKDFYCELNTPLVFGKLNEWGLAKDAERSGSLNKRDCED